MDDKKKLDRLEAAFRESKERQSLSRGTGDPAPLMPRPRLPSVASGPAAPAPLSLEDIERAVRSELERTMVAPPVLDDHLLDAIREVVRTEMQAALASIPPAPPPAWAPNVESLRTDIRDDLTTALASGLPAVDTAAIIAAITDVVTPTGPPDTDAIRAAMRDGLSAPLSEIAAALEALTHHVATDGDVAIGDAVTGLRSEIDAMLQRTANDLRREMSLIAADHHRQFERALDGVHSLRRLSDELQVLVTTFGTSSPDGEELGSANRAVTASHQVLAGQITQLATDIADVLVAEREFLTASLRETSTPARFDEILYYLERLEKRLSRGSIDDD